MALVDRVLNVELFSSVLFSRLEVQVTILRVSPRLCSLHLGELMPWREVRVYVGARGFEEQMERALSRPGFLVLVLVFSLFPW